MRRLIHVKLLIQLHSSTRQNSSHMTIFPYMISRKSDISSISDEEIADIKLFKERVEKLSESLKKYRNIPISRSQVSTDGSARIFEANTPDVDDVLNIAIKFRFFFAENEPTYFERITNIIRRNAQDEWAINYIDHIRIWYKQSLKDNEVSSGLGHQIQNKEIINLWFNSEFFHSDTPKREKLQSIHQKIGEVASLFQLYVAILSCANHIQAFYAIVHAVGSDHRHIYTPNHHFST
ncbi:MAG: hypothetical protein PHF20_00785 [Halothiobacillaceae bacterium]|nr:hypothetical protein [Halothiobacillaceae bacterium]